MNLLFFLQIGHEPMSPYKYRTLFGEQRLVLPNLITYGNQPLFFDFILTIYCIIKIIDIFSKI